MKIELHSAEEVADTLGIELDTLYRYARRGWIHGIKVGKAWRFLDADLQDFLQKQRFRGRSASAGVTVDSPSTPTTHHAFEVSHSEVDAASSMLADRLLKYGVAPKAKVLALLSNSVEFVVVYMAVLKAEAVLVSESPLLKDETIQFLLHDVAPEVLIVDRSVAERLQHMRFGLGQVRVIFITGDSSGLPGLATMRIESLEAILARSLGGPTMRTIESPEAPAKEGHTARSYKRAKEGGKPPTQ